eukprot:Selendium_serpulae@DN6303_c0_g1_i1.p1
MVAIRGSISVGGMRLAELIRMGMITEKEVEELIKRTAGGGGEVVKLLGTSAFYAPAVSAIDMAEAYLRDAKRVLPCAAHLTGQYGVKDLYVGVPCLIGGQGVEKVFEIDMTDKEKEGFAYSVSKVKELIEVMQK